MRRLTRGGVMPSAHLDARRQWTGPIVRFMVDDMERKERLAYAIRAAMAHRKLSAPDLAELIGRHPVTVGRWVRGETAPSALDVGPLAMALGVHATMFIDPPAIPEYPLAQFLIEEAVSEGVEEGLRRSAGRPAARREK